MGGPTPRRVPEREARDQPTEGRRADGTQGSGFPVKDTGGRTTFPAPEAGGWRTGGSAATGTLEGPYARVESDFHAP